MRFERLYRDISVLECDRCDYYIRQENVNGVNFCQRCGVGKLRVGVRNALRVELEPEEIRALRCEELCSRLDVRRGQMSEDDIRFVNAIVEKMNLVDKGLARFEHITRAEHSILEDLYERQLPFVTLTSEQERDLRGRLRKQAEEDFKSGRFMTFSDALVHYGIDASDEVC